MVKKRFKFPDLKFHPVTPGRWKDVETLFGKRGACGGCWCMAWRLRNKEWIAGKGARNKRAFKKIVTSSEKPGILAYLDNEPIAWCAVAPREKYLSLANSRVLKPVDDQLVWSVSCLFIQNDFRRKGISARLLKATVEFAGRQGAKIVEGYPVTPYKEDAPDAFLWTGIPSSFQKAGFKEVLRRSKVRPIMRYTVKKRGRSG